VGRFVEAETGAFAEQGVGGDIAVEAGKFDAVVEGLAQSLGAFEAEDVEQCVDVANLKFVAAVVEERA
jgi:hypothetical protein